MQTGQNKMFQVDEKAPPVGLERIPKTPRKTVVSDLGGAEGGALAGDSLLAEVLERWPSLTPQAQVQVLGLVRESTKQVAAK